MLGWIALGVLLASPAPAITVGPFGPDGEGGTINGQVFDIGPGGVVFEVDAYLNIAGQDLNGGAFGTSAQLSVDPLPAGLGYSFSSALSADTTDIILSYQFTNNTGGALAGVKFLSFVDAEIDETVNTFFNEIASTAGMLAAGQGFEADEPGFLFGDIVDNLLLGTLDDTNAFPPPEDVSMALSFELGTLVVGGTAVIDIMLSEDGDTIPTSTFSMIQTDPDSPDTEITYSGRATGVRAVIPEPNSAALFGLGALVVHRALRRRRPTA